MPMILKCKYPSGSAAFHAELIEGVDAPERRYTIENGQIILDGYAEVIVRHDATALLNVPNGMYRMFTPAEQEAMAVEQQAALTISEDVAPVPAPKSKAKQSSDDNGG